MRLEPEGIPEAPKTSLQVAVEELLSRKSGVESFEERRIGRLNLFLMTAYCRYDSIEKLERENGVQPSIYVVGTIDGSPLFIKTEYTRDAVWDDSDGWNEPTQTWLFKSGQRSVTWLMEPVEGRIPQIISYNHGYFMPSLNYPYYRDGVLAVGFQNLFDEHYYQVGLYNPDGTFERHTYCGRESGERRHLNLDTVKLIPLHAIDTKTAAWLQTKKDEYSDSVQIQETLGDALVHELTFPRHIHDLPRWKKRLFDRDNSAAFDQSFPWMSWFEELGVSLATVLSSAGDRS